MKVVQPLDYIEIDGADVTAALAEYIQKHTGRDLNFISGVKDFDLDHIGMPKAKVLQITVTLKPESK